MYKLLSVERDVKTSKSVRKGYLTGILYLKPSERLCPACSEGCRKACLFTAGHGSITGVKKCRANRTELFHNDLDKFKQYLEEDITRLEQQAKRRGLKPCVRLNGTSDINVEVVFKDILRKFFHIMFYDYTKVWNKISRMPNYYLCYSRSETTPVEDIDKRIEVGYNVAVVFDKVPKFWRGYRVINGDEHDLRFLDPSRVIVGLQAKSRAKSDTTGFVVRSEND